jgi:hypothetical protein
MHRVAAPVSISPGQGIWPGEMTLRHLQLPPDSARHREHGDDDDLAGKPWAAPLGDPGVAGRRRLFLRCLPSAYSGNQKLAMYF